MHPRAVKLAVGGLRSRGKFQVAHMIRTLLGSPHARAQTRRMRSAVAVCHAHARRLGALAQQGGARLRHAGR